MSIDGRGGITTFLVFGIGLIITIPIAAFYFAYHRDKYHEQVSAQCRSDGGVPVVIDRQTVCLTKSSVLYAK